MAQLESRLDEKVSSIYSMLDVILQSHSKIEQHRPSEAEQAAQLDQLISIRFKHTIEEVEQKYNESLDLDHHISTTSIML